MIIKPHNIIFIHISKTGGSSIRELIVEHFKHNYSDIMGMHYSLANVQDKLPSLDLNSFKVLAVKRNTWEKWASWYVQACFKHGWEHPYTKDGYNKYFNRRVLGGYLDYFRLKDGTLFNNIHTLEFDNLDTGVIEFFQSEFNITVPRVPRVRVKNAPAYGYQQEIINDPVFQDIIANKFSEEIEHFGYTIPK